MNKVERCYGCFEVNHSVVCEHCGYDNNSSPESPLFLQPGTLLNQQYVVGRVLGQGGFGVTYLAWDCNLDIKLAIKEYLPREFATRVGNESTVVPHTGNAKEEYQYGLEKFLDEAKAVAKFQNHACIISVLNFFQANDTGYMVMPYIDGMTLKDYLKTQKDQRISVDKTLSIFIPVLDALREVHSTGLLHRDISPDNIYITNNGQVKLLDFGAARQAMGEHSRSLSVVLKAGYSPEEQYRSKGKQGPWTDIYATAASMYRCISGVVPPEALDRMAEDELKPLHMYVCNTSESVDVAIRKAMSIRYQDRYENAELFQLSLSNAVSVDNNYVADHAGNTIEVAVKRNAEQENTKPIDNDAHFLKMVIIVVFFFVLMIVAIINAV